MKRTLLFLCICLMPLPAAEQDSRLVPLAATYLKQIQDIHAKSSVETTKADATYLEELKAGEEKATKSGDVKVLKVITEAKAQVEKGVALPVADLELPKLLQAQHKTNYKAHEDAEAEIAKQKQQLDAKYLAALAKLQTAALLDPDLAKQLAEEKKRVISGNFGPISNLQTQLGGTRWQSVGNPKHFEYFAPDGRFSHWKYTTPDRETVVLHWNANSSISWKLAKDGKTLLKGGAPDLKLVPAEKK